jgi:hypothetical protein
MNQRVSANDGLRTWENVFGHHMNSKLAYTCRHHHHHRQNSRFWATAFIKWWCQICLIVGHVFLPRALTSLFTTESESLYEWRQSVRLGDKPLETHDRRLFFQPNTCGHSPILSWERMGLSFTIAACPRQRSHSRVRVSRDSWPHFPVSDSRLHQPGGPDPRIYIPQERGGPVIPPGTGFPLSSPPTTRRDMVEVFDPATTRDCPHVPSQLYL